MARKKKLTCLAPGCTAAPAPSRRGCCAACYQAAYRAISKGRVTEQQLVEAGYLQPTVPVTARCGRQNLSPMRQAIEALVTAD